MGSQTSTFLSILIPVYRTDISSLVKALKNQAEDLSVPWEVIILDDASGAPWTAKYLALAESSGISCHTMKVNLGRSGARNRLASLAGGDLLLFMDADATLVDPDYLKKMIAVSDGKRVVTGRTVYPEKKPEDPARVLRWKYGRKRESVPAILRNAHPWASFSTFHFLAPATVFSRVTFPTEYGGYGHEDTLFGLELKEAGFQILHTDIPLQHEGMDEAVVFLEKTREAVDTLVQLLKAEGCSSAAVWSFRILRTYCRYRWLWHIPLLQSLIQAFLPFLYSRLSKGNTSLIFLDLYKLGWLVINYRPN